MSLSGDPSNSHISLNSIHEGKVPVIATIMGGGVTKDSEEEAEGEIEAEIGADKAEELSCSGGRYCHATDL